MLSIACSNVSDRQTMLLMYSWVNYLKFQGKIICLGIICLGIAGESK